MQGEKQIDAITNQNKIIEALTNKKSDQEDDFFEKIIELTDEINKK